MASSTSHRGLGAAVLATAVAAGVAACGPARSPSGAAPGVGAPAPDLARPLPGFRLLAAPPNDALADAAPLLVDDVGRTVELGEATADPTDPVPPCWGATVPQSVWYVYVAPEGGPPTIDLDATGSDFAPSLFTFEGSSGGLVPLACYTSGDPSRQVRLLLAVEPGRTYYVQAAALFGTTEGRLTLVARPYQPVAATLAVDPTAVLNTRTGEVTVTGTITANQPVQFSLGGRLTQKSGRVLVHGSFNANSPNTTFVSGRIPWQATGRAEPPYLFVAGKAQGAFQAFVSALDGVFLESNVTIRLTAKR